MWPSAPIAPRARKHRRRPAAARRSGRTTRGGVSPRRARSKRDRRSIARSVRSSGPARNGADAPRRRPRIADRTLARNPRIVDRSLARSPRIEEGARVGDRGPTCRPRNGSSRARYRDGVRLSGTRETADSAAAMTGRRRRLETAAASTPLPGTARLATTRRAGTRARTAAAATRPRRDRLLARRLRVRTTGARLRARRRLLRPLLLGPRRRQRPGARLRRARAADTGVAHRTSSLRFPPLPTAPSGAVLFFCSRGRRPAGAPGTP